MSYIRPQHFYSDDVLYGSSFNDVIEGLFGRDTIYGAAGGEHSDDIIFGDQANNFWTGWYPDGSYVPRMVEDEIYGKGGKDIIFGDSIYWDSPFGGSDTIDGGSGDDIIYGGAGNDKIEGSIGNDYLVGGWGQDEIYGDEDNDIIYGNQEKDMIWGNWGRDDLHGGDGDDEIYGGDDHDNLYGDGGSDILVGGEGNDNLLAGGTNAAGQANELFGGDGIDFLWSSSGSNAHTILYGGADPDQFRLGSGPNSQTKIKDFQNGYDLIGISRSVYGISDLSSVNVVYNNAHNTTELFVSGWTQSIATLDGMPQLNINSSVFLF